jgi:hypothetical protein
MGKCPADEKQRPPDSAAPFSFGSFLVSRSDEAGAISDRPCLYTINFSEREA